MILPFAAKPPKSHTRVEAVFWPDNGFNCALTLYASSVQAGFPSAVEDYAEGRLDLNQHLIKHPRATFIVRVSGDSMIDAGIHPGDLLLVDRSLKPRDGKIVIAVINSELTVKRIFKNKGKLYLMPENPDYPTIEITKEMDFMVWGVVTNVIHPL